jgi:DNA helicase-2/ATP-dependent DNA helicase PcrA
MCELSVILAAHEGSGYVVAPAGYGKTYLIAEATARSAGRQLILTHTYAGVNALRRKMRTLGVSDRLYRIDTIASWSLRLSLSYSGTSSWVDERPADNERWSALYDACSRLLDHAFIRRIVRASYDGLYVDEYQDCSEAQHSIILKLARDLPCRILGDPLQGIFDFEGQNPIDWARDVEDRFERLCSLDVPHRWIQAGVGSLGEWLRNVRTQLEQGHPIDLNADCPAAVDFTHADADPQALIQSQGNTCRYFNCDGAHTVIAIHKGSQEYKARCHTLSRNLSGRFSSIEEVEGKDLFSFIRKIDSARTDAARLQEVIAFAKRCMTAVEQNLPAGTVRGEEVNIRANTRNPEAARKANAYLAAPTSSAMAGFLLALKQTAGVEVVRADLFNRALGVLGKHVLHPGLCLAEAAENYHGEFRYKGRPVGRRRLIGTTLLVKGLEFDHAIVLDAASLSKKELYVALTRGARSLTIISTSPVLNPGG